MSNNGSKEPLLDICMGNEFKKESLKCPSLHVISFEIFKMESFYF